MIAYLFQCKIVINNATVGFIQMELHCYSKKNIWKINSEKPREDMEKVSRDFGPCI